MSDTVHNLAVTGPGTVRAVSEQQVCVFCHAPHHTAGVRPLWNRELPATSYAIYQSSTLDAQPGQPTGASKLCLSCHDGTIALGSVLSRSDIIRMNGSDFMPAGMTNLGTDLSDDHPISFYYTSGLAASDTQLADPTTLPPNVRLDASGQLQCTACHDAHDNTNGKFLVMANVFGGLCTACHALNGWATGAHQLSSASVVGSPTLDLPYDTVAENACRSCHRAHTAGGAERLLIFENEEDNCLGCHDGSVAAANIEAQLDKPSAHDPRHDVGVHDPIEGLAGANPHVECADCHNPHAVYAQPPVTGYIPIGATLTNVPGVTIGGAVINEAQFEYEVCFRCHGDAAVPIANRVGRLADTPNLRLKFGPSNPSFHPVVTSSPSADTPSLVPGLAPGSMVRCTDCHNNEDGPGAGGGGPTGPHGSVNGFLLERNYNVQDEVEEAEFEYAMCYKCHLRSSILGDDSFTEHKRHIQNELAPCSACHDPHGVSLTLPTGSDHTHLINFDTSIVFPESQTGKIEFKDLGPFAGSCTLQCHGEDHRNEAYQR
ncbi:MAG: cytochrome c3 family protein [Phycisphaerae bacterium]